MPTSNSTSEAPRAGRSGRHTLADACGFNACHLRMSLAGQLADGVDGVLQLVERDEGAGSTQ